jgi:hypothetical protein
MTFIKGKADIEAAKLKKKSDREAAKVVNGKGKGRGKASLKRASSPVPSASVSAVKRVGTSTSTAKLRSTRASDPNPKITVDKSIVCYPCLHYMGDPEDPDQEWTKCKQCAAWYHVLCATAMQRCKCGTRFYAAK